MDTSEDTSTSSASAPEATSPSPTKAKTFKVRVEAPRTCVTTLEVTAASRKAAERRALDIVKFNEQPLNWHAGLPFSSLGMRATVTT